jgi:Chaperone of endosialidase/Domain of unknown function (DUF5011)
LSRSPAESPAPRLPSAPSLRIGIGNITNNYGLWIADQTGATNSYAFWYDSLGVYRVKADGVMAYYNPTFTKYTPGATNFERVVQQWSNNVVQYGTENSGTGVARALSFITASTTRVTIGTTGNVGIGTSTPYSRLTVWGPDTAAGTAALTIANNASTTELQVFDNGNATLAGTLTQNSDSRLKTNIQTLDASTSLARIIALIPVTFTWVDPAQGGNQVGFIAQDVQKIFPELIATTTATALTPGGTLGLNYIGLISPIVSAIQALSRELHSLEQTVAGFANSFTTKQLCVDKSDGTAVCINGDQLAGILSGTPSVQISAPTPPTISGTTTPPSINIQSVNPATINVGDTYTDLGALVTDNQGHDLGYRTFLNGALVSNILIDTSQVATDTIDYVATDTWGNTSTSTRTVLIEASASSTSI